MPESTVDAAGRPYLTLDTPVAEVVFHPSYFPTSQSDRLLRQLVETTQWQQDSMKMFGELEAVVPPHRIVRRRGGPLRLLRHRERPPALDVGPRR